MTKIQRLSRSTMDLKSQHPSENLQTSSSSEVQPLDLRTFSPIFVSATHIETDDLHELEEELERFGATLTYDVKEAGIILSKVVKKARVQFDLRSKGLWTEEVESKVTQQRTKDAIPPSEPRATKRKREEVVYNGKEDIDAIVVDGSTTEDEVDMQSRSKTEVLPAINSPRSDPPTVTTQELLTDLNEDEKTVKVVRVTWFTDSKARNRLLPLESYVTYIGRTLRRSDSKPRPLTAPVAPLPRTLPESSAQTSTAESPSAKKILDRAKEDEKNAPTARAKYDRFGRRRYGLKTPSANPASWEAGHGTNSQYAHLLQSMTSEQEDGYSSDIPEMPQWVKTGAKYACERPTPKNNPNEQFISELKKIKLARLLTNDDIGVRAYSTSIASLAAYPHKIVNPREIMKLPGCDAKIANLYVEWANTGSIQAVDELEADEDLKVLRVFYDIWGVGATTAREFFYERGWRDLDDVVEFGWKTLSRVQQIGVKFYDEFQDPIPRTEVAEIGRIIHRHAVQIRDERIQTMLVGGYRRGKEACGDVDILISHPEESQTANLANDIVASLEEEEWITHTLLLTLHNTHRGQQTLPFRSGGGGHGFDSLDKALVVWQDPTWSTRDQDLAEKPKAKNPNIHRRVDIIISPWRTVGCAVVGWSGGTTFERDLRRYAKNVKAWKFDSSGVRDRRNGEVVDLEGYYMWKGKDGSSIRAKTMEEAEKRVFEGFGIEYREPWDRCTG